MVDVLGIFLGAVGPIVAIAGVGYVLGTFKDVDPGPLNTAVVYVLAPALVFHSLAVTELAASTLQWLTVGIVAFTVAMWAVGEFAGRLLGEREPILSALVLTVMFTNAGNLGIPVSDFAFGGVGRQTAVVFLSVQSVLMYTLGVYVASRSGGSPGLAGVKRVFRLPLVYAVVAALGARALDLVPPTSNAGMEAIQLTGDASIPIMLLILGVQLARTDAGTAVSRTWSATVLRLGVAPVVGLAVALVLPFGDATVARVFVLEAAMPAAVTPVILVGEFAAGVRSDGVSVPEYVSTCVLVTTLLGVPVLTALIAVLQSGVVL
ncbi:AEC family transporter [Halobacterium sp. R2-5]|uniref:AEC family transporter n=1 Tax=Halobacterium sp. R2-5 TaxID=2715751 RepID=UPI0014247380|nr:AEC family transporter [Halobacterium sp. R2-5]NIC00056.1 AEC family transporter [Halobacterium sp. R2-5]